MTPDARCMDLIYESSRARHYGDQVRANELDQQLRDRIEFLKGELRKPVPSSREMRLRQIGRDAAERAMKLGAN